LPAGFQVWLHSGQLSERKNGLLLSPMSIR
jgi:hypothetical protein